MTSQLLRPLTPSKLLLSVAYAGISAASLAQDYDAANYPTLTTMARGAVLTGTYGSISWNAYRCNERDKVALLRFLAVEGASPTNGTTVGVAVALLPRFSTTPGASAADSLTMAAVAGTGNSLARMGRATLTTTNASLLASRTVEPWTGTTLPGSLTRALRPFTLAWTRQDDANMFTDSGFVAGGLGQMILDLSCTEFVVTAVESISSSASVAGMLCGIEVEAQ